MQKYLNLSKRALAMILVVAMLLPAFSSLSMLGVFASEEDEDVTTHTTTDGKIVAENYDLTDEEKVLLESGCLIGASHEYRVPGASDDLISIDTDHKTVTAKSFEKTAGYLWNPVSAEIVVNENGNDVVKETIIFTNNKAAYTTTATAFYVRVKYEVRKEVSVATQELLLNAATLLKDGVANLDKLLDPQGDVMKALDSFTSFSLTSLPKDENNPTADTKGVLQLLLEDGYKYSFEIYGQTIVATLKFKDTITTVKEGFAYTEQEAATALVAQLTANDGKLDLAVIAAEYKNASSKVEYLVENAERIQKAVVDTYEYLYALTDDSGTLLGPLSMMGSVPTLKAALESYIGYIVSLAGDKSWADPDRNSEYELIVNKTGSLEEYCSDDAWKIIGKDVLRDDLSATDYLALDIMVGKLGDDLKGASVAVTNPLVVDTATVQFKMSMYDVKINVTLKLTENALNSANTVVYEKKTVTLTLGQNITKDEIQKAINNSKAEENALSAWAGVFVDGKFDRAVSALPDTLTGDIEYNVTYTPKTYTVNTSYAGSVVYPYGYQLVLPVHEDEAQSYDYWVNGTYYAQGSVVAITDDTTINQGTGKAYTSFAISTVMANKYFAANAKASAILTSGALKTKLANTTVNVRVPEETDGLVTLKDSKLSASTYASSYEGLSWVPYTYTVVTENGSRTYEFGGATTAIIEEDDYVRVEVTYRLDLTTIASSDVKALLDLIGTLSDDAVAQKAALDRLNNYYGMMGKDTISVGILNGLKSFVSTSSDISEESKTTLINAIDGVVANCFEGDTLRMYVLLTGYRNDGLAYYYKNSDVFMNEIDLLGDYLSGIVSEEAALRTVIDGLGMGDNLSSQVDKLSSLEGAIAELKAALTAPNAAIDLNSANLDKLTDALEMTGNVDYVADDFVLYLTSGRFIINADTKVTVQVTIQNETLPPISFNKDHVLDADDIKAITDAIDAKVAEKNLTDKYYTTNYDAGVFTALIGKEADSLEKTSFVFTYEPKEYTVKVEGVGNATVSIGNLKVTLPASTSPEYRYDYYVNGVKVTTSSYTFSMTQFDAIIAAGGFTIQRVVVDVREEEYKALVDELNTAIGSDIIVFALTKNNGEYAIIMKLDASNPGAFAGAVQALATKLINYSYVAFEDNAFIYDDGGSKISFQALISTVMDSGFSSDTIIGMMNANGVINNMKMPGTVISDKKVTAAGALLAETEFCLGLSKDQLSYQIPMYITLGAAPEYLTQLRNLLADQLGAYFTFECVNGKAVLSFNMPQKAYEAYLAVLLATDNVDITDVNGINEDVAIGFLENVIRPLMMSDASATSVENTLNKFGFNINFSEYEQAFDYIRSLYKKSAFAYDDLESTYDMGIDISIAGYLDSMNLGNLGNMIVEKDTGIHVDLGVSLVNLDKNYEALYFDIGAAGITNKFGLVEDIASKLGTMSGTAVVILLSDVEGDLTFKTTTVLNLNGFAVNGDIVGKGSVRIVDSVIDEGSCGVVTGKVSGKVLIAGGQYTTDVSAFIPEGYEQDENGVVANKFMTIVRDDAGNINVKFNAGILATRSIPDIKTIVADIGVEILLNGFTANKLYFNDKKVFELTVDDLVGLYSATDRMEALMNSVMTMVDGQDLVDIINILLGDLTNFKGMKDTLDQDIANGTETPLLSYDLVTGTWGFSINYVEEEDYISADITTGQDQARKLNFILSGTTEEKQYVSDLLAIFAESTDADVSVQVAVGRKSSTVTVDVGLNADVKVDFSNDPKYAVMLSVIVADGIGAPANADLVAGLKTYFETDDMSDLTKAFNKVTLAQLVTAVENYERNDTFVGMLNKLGLSGYDTVDAEALGADIAPFAKVLGILARRVDVTGPSIKMEAALDQETYAYTIDKENIKRSFDLNLVAGYSATINAELVDVFASVKLFNDPKTPALNFSALEAEISRIEALGLAEGDYTAESWAEFAAALDVAKRLLATATTQAEIEAALAMLTAAYNKLEKKPVVPTIDYSALQAEIDRIESLGLSADDYTADTWYTFKTALEAAKALINNATTQGEVTTALANLIAAFEGLKKAPTVTTIDYSMLRVKLLRLEALGLVADDYTETSWNVFKAAWDAAKALLDNANSQEEVDAALANLSAAYDGLQKKDPVVIIIDYSALQAEIDRIEALGLVEGEYTATSWSVFKAALDAAKALIDNATAQADVDAALAALTAAANNLVKKPGEVDPTIIYTALQAEINRIDALGLVEGDYTEASWSVFKAAYDAAKALINNATTQDEVNAALNTLTAAANALVKKDPVAPTIDYTALQAEIDRIEALGLVEGDYTEASWSVFKAALDAAKALINNATSQNEVATALTTLTTAADNLVKKPVAPTVDYDALQAEIDRIEALNLVEDEYTAETWATYKAAYDAAKALINNATSQDDVDAALTALTAAYNALEKKAPAPTVDYAELEAEIQRIETLNLAEGDYTADSWAAFKAAYDAAKALLANATTQDEVNAALAALTAAYEALVKKTPVAPSIDYSALQAEIDRIEALNLAAGDYTADSWATFKAALEAAEALINNAGTQAEVDSVLATLTAAYNGLTKSETTPPGEEPGGEEPGKTEEDDGLDAIWIIIIVAGAIVVIAGIAAVVVLNIKKKKKTTDSTPLVDYNIDDDNA